MHQISWPAPALTFYNCSGHVLRASLNPVPLVPFVLRVFHLSYFESGQSIRVHIIYPSVQLNIHNLKFMCLHSADRYLGILVLIFVRGLFDPRAIVRLEGLGKVKNRKIQWHGNRTRDLPACSTVPQPTTLQLAPVVYDTQDCWVFWLCPSFIRSGYTHSIVFHKMHYKLCV
jgi:hypothetical protein